MSVEPYLPQTMIGLQTSAMLTWSAECQPWLRLVQKTPCDDHVTMDFTLLLLLVVVVLVLVVLLLLLLFVRCYFVVVIFVVVCLVSLLYLQFVY